MATSPSDEGQGPVVPGGKPSFLRSLALAGVVVVPLLYLPGFRDGFTLPKFAAAGVLSAAGACWIVLHRGRGWAGSSVDLPLWAFLGAALLSALFSIDPWLSWNGPDKQYLWGLPGMAACAGGFYLGCAAFGPGERRERLLLWMAAGSIPVALLAVGQMLLPALGLGSGPDQAHASFGHHTYLGAYFALCLPAALHLARNGFRVGAAAAVLALIGLALTGSRAPWLGAALGAGIYLWGTRSLSAGEGRSFFPHSPRSRLLIGAVLIALTALFGASALKRLALTRTVMLRGDAARITAWTSAVRLAARGPWTGSGPGTFSLGFRRIRGSRGADLSWARYSMGHAHNDWFEVLASMGLLGLLGYAWLHAAALKRLAGMVRSGSDLALAAGLLSIVVHAKFNSPSFGVAWLAALIAGSLFSSNREGYRLDFAWKRAVVPASALLAVLLGLATGLRLLAADTAATLGRGARRSGRPRLAAVRFERAVALAPGVLLYRLDLANLLWDAAGSGAGEARTLHARLVRLGLDAVRHRPLEAEAHRLLGLALMRRFAAVGEGSLDDALRAFEASLLLDPYHVRTHEDITALERLRSGQGASRPSGIRPASGA